MTPEQAACAALLPATLDEVARKTGRALAAVKQDLEMLYQKGIVLPKDHQSRDYFRFSKHAERLWEGTESLMGLEIYTEGEMKIFFMLWDYYEGALFCKNLTRRKILIKWEKHMHWYIADILSDSATISEKG